MNNTHTPAPWKVNADDGESISIIGNAVGCRGSQHVASVVYDDKYQSVYLPHIPSHEKARANARLIAAAPVMLEAIKQALLTAYETYPPDMAEDYPHIFRLEDAIRAAVGENGFTDFLIEHDSLTLKPLGE